MSSKLIKEVKKKDQYLVKDLDGNISRIVFPHTIKVGIPNNSVFNATISGSIHHTHEGKSYLVEGSGINISSGSNGQITISASGGSGGITVQDEGVSLSTTATTLNFTGTGITATGTGTTKTITVNNLTVTRHAHNWWLSSMPSGNPTSYFYGHWPSSTLASVDPENSAYNQIWKYFPYGGEITKVYGFGDRLSNPSAANPFTENAVFAIHKWSNEFIDGISGATAVRPAIFHVTASPETKYVEESGTYYHSAIFTFDLTSGTGTTEITSGDVICISFKGEGGGNGFGRSNFFMHWDENIS